MPKLIFTNGILSVTLRYVTTKADGSLMYQRRVPADLRELLAPKIHSRKTLGRVSPAQAAKLVAALVKRDDDYWASLRAHPTTPDHIKTKVDRRLEEWRKLPAEQSDPFDYPTEAESLHGIMGDHLRDTYGDAFRELEEAHGTLSGTRYDRAIKSLVTPLDYETTRRIKALQAEAPRVQPTLSQALERYIDGKPKAWKLKASAGVRFAIAIVYTNVGDKPLGDYRREDANRVRDAILGTGAKTGTARRRLNDIRAVFNMGCIEFDQRALPNPFDGLKIPGEGDDAKKRLPFTDAELSTLAGHCQTIADPRRLILAMMIETGARLAEIVGLRTEDVFLDAPVPFVWIREHKSLGRTLKNPQSNRRIPLGGVSLWAARSVSKAHPWLFPEYASSTAIKANSASATLNKWMLGVLKVPKTCHSFRHSMKDRLRAKVVSEDIQKVILGHGELTTGDGYGEGYSLQVLKEHMPPPITFEA